MKNKRLSLQQREERTAWLTLIPLCTILLVFRFIPIVIDFVMSFTNWDGGIKANFVGLNNYITLAKNGELWTMLKNSLLLLLYLPIRLFIAFIFALYIYEKLPGAKTFSILYYLPQMISIVVLGSVIKYVFRNRGIVNMLLQAVGLETVDFLGDGQNAIWVILFAMVWHGLGWQMLILSGGLSSMDKNILEAATIDGAGYWQKLIHVIIPMMSRTIEYSIIVSIIFVFTGLYNFIFSITNGGPGYSTTTLDYMVYLKAFKNNGMMGMACAVAVVLLVIVLILVIIQRKATDKAGDWE